jgi:16S rRNA processing protein RimM
VALVRGFRGLHGQIRVELLTDRPEDRFGVGTVLYVEGTDRGLVIAESAAVADGPGWWLRFRELPSRDAAEALRDVYLEIDAPVEEREPGRWFFHELEGLAVRTTTGEDLGTIEEIYRAGGAEVFVVRGPRGELDIPGVKGIVAELAPDRGVMIVDMEAFDLDARPVEEDYVRPRDRRPQKQPRPKGPAQPPKGTGPVRRPVDPAAAKGDPKAGFARPAKGAKTGVGPDSAPRSTPRARASDARPATAPPPDPSGPESPDADQDASSPDA